MTSVGSSSSFTITYTVWQHGVSRKTDIALLASSTVQVQLATQGSLALMQLSIRKVC